MQSRKHRLPPLPLRRQIARAVSPVRRPQPRRDRLSLQQLPHHSSGTNATRSSMGPWERRRWMFGTTRNAACPPKQPSLYPGFPSHANPREHRRPGGSHVTRERNYQPEAGIPLRVLCVPLRPSALVATFAASGTTTQCRIHDSSTSEWPTPRASATLPQHPDWDAGAQRAPAGGRFAWTKSSWRNPLPEAGRTTGRRASSGRHIGVWFWPPEPETPHTHARLSRSSAAPTGTRCTPSAARVGMVRAMPRTWSRSSSGV